MSETKEYLNIQKAFNENRLMNGRMIAGSKSSYCERHPNNKIVFNANLFVLGEGKIWYGDIDLTLEENEFKNVASQLSKTLYVLREMDGRFENETLPDSEIIKRAFAKIEP